MFERFGGPCSDSRRALLPFVNCHIIIIIIIIILSSYPQLSSFQTCTRHIYLAVLFPHNCFPIYSLTL